MYLLWTEFNQVSRNLCILKWSFTSFNQKISEAVIPSNTLNRSLAISMARLLFRALPRINSCSSGLLFIVDSIDRVLRAKRLQSSAAFTVNCLGSFWSTSSSPKYDCCTHFLKTEFRWPKKSTLPFMMRYTSQLSIPASAGCFEW